MDFGGPRKLISGHRIDRYRNNEKRSSAHGDFLRSVAQKEKQHPGKQDHAVAIGELPATGISVGPKREPQQADRDPDDNFVGSGLAKNYKQKRARKKDAATERMK